MRKQHKSSQNVANKPGGEEMVELLDHTSASEVNPCLSGHLMGRDSEMDITDEKIEEIAPQLPLETQEECTWFLFFLYCPQLRSIHKAYQLYCEANGIGPQKDPPSCW